jgi:hypothetical protein
MHASIHPSSRLEKSYNIYDKQLKDDKSLSYSCIFLHLYKRANETEEIEPNGNRLRSKSFTELINGFSFGICPPFTVFINPAVVEPNWKPCIPYDSSFATITSKNNKMIVETVCYLWFFFKRGFIVSFAPFLHMALNLNSIQKRDRTCRAPGILFKF